MTIAVVEGEGGRPRQVRLGHGGAVGVQRRVAAVLEPPAHGRAAAERVDHHLLMVAAEADGQSLGLPAHGEVDHAAGCQGPGRCSRQEDGGEGPVAASVWMAAQARLSRSRRPWTSPMA
jgi:hypothetical protein